MEPTCYDLCQHIPFSLISESVCGNWRWGTYHLVDRFNNLEHLIVANLPVSVYVVQLESPIELVLHLAPARHAEGTNELLEVNRPGLVGVKDIKNIIGK